MDGQPTLEGIFAKVSVLEERESNTRDSVEALRGELSAHCKQHRQLAFFLIPTLLTLIQFVYIVILSFRGFHVG